MRVGIVSDTHGDVEAWRKVMQIFSNVDVILHCGDVLYHGPRNPIVAGYNPGALSVELGDLNVPVICARGNCDADVDQLVLPFVLQEPGAVFWQELKIFIHHGHLWMGEKLVKVGAKQGAEICCHGHNHIPEITQYGDIWLINPGSPSLPKGGHPPTAALIEAGQAKLINIETGEVIVSQNLR